MVLKLIFYNIYRGVSAFNFLIFNYRIICNERKSIFRSYYPGYVWNFEYIVWRKNICISRQTVLLPHVQNCKRKVFSRIFLVARDASTKYPLYARPVSAERVRYKSSQYMLHYFVSYNHVPARAANRSRLGWQLHP